MLTPEQQLRNVAAIVIEQTTPTRRWNGRGRNASYSVDKEAMAGSAKQMAEMILAYLDGKLPSKPDSDLPF